MPAPEPTAPESTTRSFLRGVAWAFLLRWGLRGIGLVNTVILARLLTPGDFGLVAMGTLVMGFLQGFTQIGVQMLLIREPQTSREHCDTAWTLKLAQGAAIAVLLVILAEPAAGYFQEPRVVEVMTFLSLVALLNGASSIGMVLVRKELDFARDFRYSIYCRLVAFVATVGLALVLRSYWALVIGQIVAAGFGVLLSFRMHPYRPRLSLAKARDYLRFGLSILPFNIGEFLNAKADVMVVGGIANTSQMGGYHVASELSALVTQEVVATAGRGLYPNYAKLAGERERLKTAYGHVLNSMAILCFPLGLGLWAVAEDFVAVVLGRQWAYAVPLLEWLALYGMLSSLVAMFGGHILIVTGHERVSAWLMWLRVGLLIPLVWMAGTLWGVEAVAMAATATAAAMVPVAMLTLHRTVGIGWGDQCRWLWRPLGSALVMVALVRLLHQPALPAFVSLALDVLVGALAYCTVLLGLWWATGRPAGVENSIIAYLHTRRRRAPV